MINSIFIYEKELDEHRTDRFKKNPSTTGAAESSPWQNLKRKGSLRILKVECCWGHVWKREEDEPAAFTMEIENGDPRTHQFGGRCAENVALMRGAHAVRRVIKDHSPHRRRSGAARPLAVPSVASPSGHYCRSLFEPSLPSPFSLTTVPFDGPAAVAAVSSDGVAVEHVSIESARGRI
ncbi:hypothetical protein PRIPAC_70554 [Pristionchus pacificus]|uniref:Uncharacterized protein n=1 Tax=Pristionchus pacificus TaxID=54126 RepID=A0A2A6C6T5_PRIPA|nr:hypothetical protein PRIPAC_70554 [Pristionchus pacificus]|eukprot:PDM73778.1 hypothetical protein PRIPAC_41134 [Pristionchus pacificus]